MGDHIFYTIFLWIVGMAFSVVGGIMVTNEEDGGGFVLWVGGMVLMSAIWESWVLHKFYMLPLGL